MQVPDEWDPELKEKIKDAYHSEFDIEEARNEAIRRLPKNHAWAKFGPHAVCQSCHSEHSYYIGPLKKLEKNDKGEFLIVDITFDAPSSQ